MRLTPRVAGFRSEYPAGFKLECMAGFVGTRTREMYESELKGLRRNGTGRMVAIPELEIWRGIGFLAPVSTVWPDLKIAVA